MNKGILYAAGAYFIWGLFPFYWKVLGNVPALQVLGHRILWSFILVFGITLVSGQWGDFRRNALHGKMVLIYIIAAVLIAINWLTYVWAVPAGYVVETSLGYFINPLVSVLLGVIFFHERLRLQQWIPIGLAAFGVIFLTVVYGSLPWISLSLALSFGFYGLVKKSAPLNSLQGMTLETGILFLPALVFLAWMEILGKGSFLHVGALENWMLAGAGVVTTFPLLLFASASHRIPLSMMGVLQYINPTLQFLLGTLVYHEPFTLERFIGFAIVWVALILFGLEGIYARRKKLSPVEAG